MKKKLPNIGFEYRTKIKRRVTDPGESIEEMIRRSVATKQPIETTSHLIYTEKKDGIKPEYNIRTDRQVIAVQAADKLAATMAMATQAAEKIEEQQDVEQEKE